MTQYPRTWTAIIRVEQGRTVTEIPATDSEYDLLKEQRDAAVREAAPLATGDARVAVILVKRTVARGMERDRSYTIGRDRRGRLWVDGPYAPYFPAR